MMSITPAGPEFQVNAFEPDNQLYPSVAADADGDFVVAWESNGQDGSGYGVYFQRYNQAGTPLGGPVRAANTTFGNQYSASVGMDDAGNFVVAWTTELQDEEGYAIYARRFDADGNPLGDEFRVNTVGADNQTDPSVAVDPDGDFVIAWQSNGNDGSLWGVFARRFDETGAPQGGEFQVNTTTAGVQAFPQVATDDAGGFVVVWHSSPTGDAGTYDVFGRAFDAAGAALTPEVAVNTTTAGDQAYPDVDRDAAGNIVVVWRSDGQDEDGATVVARQFTAAGAAGPEIQVNTTTAGDQSFPAVSVQDNGQFLVTWYSENQDAAGGNGVYARQFSAAGAPMTGEVQVNQFTAGNQDFPDIAGDGLGHYAVAWNSENQDQEGGYGIFARQLTAGPNDTTAPTVDIVDVEPDPRTTPVDSITIVFSEPVQGFTLSDLRLFRDDEGNVLTGAQTLTTTDNQTFVLGNLAPLTRDAGDYVLFLDAEPSGVTDAAGNPLAADAQDQFRIDSAVVGRSIFYNNSRYDGNNPAANAADDNAIDPTKQALLPGGDRATYANYSNYTNGVNGIIIDVRGLPSSTLTADNFRFRVGNNNNPNTWSEGPAPSQIVVREGAGAGGSDRIEITFPDRSIRNTWLEVTLITTEDTGLAESDVFYFGNLYGETGDNPNNALVNALDLAGTRQHLNESATISSPYDHNKDGRVNALDLAAVRQNLNRHIVLIRPVDSPDEPGPTPTVAQSLFGDAPIV